MYASLDAWSPLLDMAVAMNRSPLQRGWLCASSHGTDLGQYVQAGVDDLFNLDGIHGRGHAFASGFTLGWHHDALNNSVASAVGAAFIAPGWSKQYDRWCADSHSQMRWTVSLLTTISARRNH